MLYEVITHKFRDRAGRNDFLPFAPRCRKTIDLFDRTIVHRDGESLTLHIEDKILTHDGQPYQTNSSMLFSYNFV